MLLRNFSLSKGFTEYNNPLFFASLVLTLRTFSSQDVFLPKIVLQNFIAIFFFF